MEAFVYCWTNLDNGNKYIGYHKGSEDDGYVCSSRSDRFWQDWETHSWSRQIIAYGSMLDCQFLERKILGALDIKSNEFYNNSNNLSSMNTPEVNAKRAASHRGMKRSELTKQRIAEANRRSKGNCNYKKTQCPHCGLIGGIANMKRYHFDKCKQKEK